MILLRLVYSLLLLSSVTTELLIAPMDGRSSTGERPASGILRHYPASGAHEVPCVTNIGITAVTPFDASANSVECWMVSGSISGVHAGAITLSDNRSTAIFTPTLPFQLGESVSVSLHTSCADGNPISCDFTFTTLARSIALPTSTPFSMHDDEAPARNTLGNASKGMRPLDVVGTTTVDNNPTPGTIFLSIIPGPAPPMGLIISDENSNTLFSLSVNAMDFIRQPNGEMTYFAPSHDTALFYAIDSLGNAFQSFGCINGVTPDGHELIVKNDGGYTILGESFTTANMTKYGGDDSAIIQGGVIQTFDAGGNLTFEWRGIDYYNILDDVLPEDFLRVIIDFEHANSIDIDSDGNYLLSNRELSEITKIDGKTGDIIWRFGGNHNQFTLVDDTLGISCQHFARWLKNGDMLLFDNGVTHPVLESRAVEYDLDTTTMTATLKWQFRHSPAAFSYVEGDAERLDNGNTFIGWGSELTVSATEVDSNGTVVYEMVLPATTSYRALKYPYAAPAAVSAIAPAQAGLSLSVVDNANGCNISAGAASPASASIALYDAAGRVVQQIFSGTISPDVQHFSLTASSLSAGAYFCLLHSSEGEMMRPVFILH